MHMQIKHNHHKFLYIWLGLLLVVLMLMAPMAASATGDEECVPKDAWTETIEHPAVTEVQTIVVEEAWTEVIPAVPDRWENLAWYIWTGGPTEEPPALDASGWHGPQPNVPNGAPHDAEPGNVYSTSDGNGRASWFKYDGDFIEGTPEQVIEHPAVTEEREVVVEEAWIETIEHPAVTCEEPTDPPVDECVGENGEDLCSHDECEVEPCDEGDEPKDPQEPKDPETPTNPEEPTDPKDPQEPVTPTEPEEPTEPTTPAEPTTKSVCLGGALVQKITDADGNSTTRTINGHPSCAQVTEAGEPFQEEGM